MVAIAGFVPFTMIDYPEHLSAVIFFQGCPLRCPFCHNPDLQTAGTTGVIAWEDIVTFLTERKGRLDAVVLSGGEPLMQPDIVEKAHLIKNMGYQIAVHTSGYYPGRLQEMLPLIDWVGLDIKAPWDKYTLMAPLPDLADNVQKTLTMLVNANINFETRTTADPRFLEPSDIIALAKDLKAHGVQHFVLQRYRTFDKDSNPPSESAILKFENDSAMMTQVKTLFPDFFVRY